MLKKNQEQIVQITAAVAVAFVVSWLISPTTEKAFGVSEFDVVVASRLAIGTAAYAAIRAVGLMVSDALTANQMVPKRMKTLPFAILPFIGVVAIACATDKCAAYGHELVWRWNWQAPVNEQTVESGWRRGLRETGELATMVFGRLVGEVGASEPTPVRHRGEFVLTTSVPQPIVVEPTVVVEDRTVSVPAEPTTIEPERLVGESDADFGRRLLKGWTHQAAGKLAGVESHHREGHLIVNMFSEEMVMAIWITEHLDTSAFLAATTSERRKMVDEVLARIGKDGYKVFANQTSNWGAVGGPQMHPVTAANLAVAYPEVGLLAGRSAEDVLRSDPVAGLEAMYLRLDEAWRAFLRAKHENKGKRCLNLTGSMANSETVFKAFAASYNFSKVAKSVVLGGDGWIDELPEEARNFMLTAWLVHKTL